MRRTDHLFAGLELIAAWLLAAVVALVFVSVVLRYVFHWGLPDNFDIGRNLLGIAIFWGIALAGFRGEHITVDLVWGALGAHARQAVDLFASAVSLLFMASFTWAMTDKVISTYRDHVLTFDLHLPVWLFFAAAWLGILLSVPLLLVRSWRLLAMRN